MPYSTNSIIPWLFQMSGLHAILYVRTCQHQIPVRASPETGGDSRIGTSCLLHVQSARGTKTQNARVCAHVFGELY